MSSSVAECDRRGHDEYPTYRDEDVTQFRCARCGAEWEEETPDEV